MPSPSFRACTPRDSIKPDPATLALGRCTYSVVKQGAEISVSVMLNVPRHQPIPYPGFGHDEARVCGIVADFVSDVSDGDA